MDEDPTTLPALGAMCHQVISSIQPQLTSAERASPQLQVLFERTFYTSFGFALQAFGRLQSLPMEGERRALEKLMEEQLAGFNNCKYPNI